MLSLKIACSCPEDSAEVRDYPCSNTEVKGIARVDDTPKDIIKLARKQKTEPEVVLRLMKDQNLDSVPDLQGRAVSQSKPFSL